MPVTLRSIELLQHRVPLLAGRRGQCLLEVLVSASGAGSGSISVRGLELHLTPGSDGSLASAIEVHHGTPGSERRRLARLDSIPAADLSVPLDAAVGPGDHRFTLCVDVPDSPPLDASLEIHRVRVLLADGRHADLKPTHRFAHRPAVVLRSAGQDAADTYRIPGIVTTNAGTLIAVYDVRYNNDRDLQEDVNIGMSRSTDGGRSWEPMRVILDMGEWGGRDRRRNGVGDPCILYDPASGTVWVAALWLSGLSPEERVFRSSRPGLAPEETGQLLLVKSADDGLTWSAPVNITAQVKDPAWQLLLQGPGRGITRADGTLVLPAQFTADTGVEAMNGGRYTPFATIIWSADGGETWRIGSGARDNTTEAQVVELSDGSLMLNMRDDRNRTEKGSGNGRAVAVTLDLGRTWAVHPTSNGALPEPNCMASIIAADVPTDDGRRRVLFFSNPDSTSERAHMTVKASLDDGGTWPAALQVELCGPAGYGYSCLTMADERTVGIVYEGVKELYFQRVPVRDILAARPGGRSAAR